MALNARNRAMMCPTVLWNPDFFFSFFQVSENVWLVSWDSFFNLTCFFKLYSGFILHHYIFYTSKCLETALIINLKFGIIGVVNS